MSSVLSDYDAIKFFKEVVEKPLKNRNMTFYHPCCGSYSTRACLQEVIDSHPEKIPFTTLFTYTEKISTVEMCNQAQKFFKDYCQVFGLPDQIFKNLAHPKVATDLADEEEEAIKEKVGRDNDDSVDSEDDSRYAKSVCLDPKKMKAEDDLLKRVLGTESQLSRLTPQMCGFADANRKLVKENERLSGELEQLKTKQAQQELVIKSLIAKLETVLKALPDGFLGKREPIEVLQEAVQTTTDELPAKAVLQSENQQPVGRCTRSKKQ